MVNTRERLIAMLEHPASVEPDLLEELVLRYPYFQAPRALLLARWHEKDPTAYGNWLPKAAVVTTDRAHLRRFVLKGMLPQAPAAIPESEKAEKEAELKIQKETRETEKVSTNLVEAKKEGIEETAPLESREESSTSSPSRMRYTEWVKYFARSRKEPPSFASKPDKTMALIERFLASGGEIRPSRPPKSAPGGAPLPEAERSVTEHPGLMTETLANLYIKQKKYDKALKAFEILKLKYPSKNRYFARRMAEVKSLMNQKNHRA
ncbi:MAG: hypothetical protein GXO27_03750 [Chlorobi bacterium]|nr:hypothetical protein [Chlorobiota bacterium]